jgi:DNA (cytosine-5)-methyltransferase 1
MLDLFSGIAGLSLSAEWTGDIETVCFCDNNKFSQQLLALRYPNIPIIGDIHEVTKEKLITLGVMGDGRPIDIICGGFPCQPFSVAGNQRGKEDNRYLWPEMLRIISEIRPTWVIGENVAGIINMALDTVLSDLENIGYSCEAFVFPACAVEASHERERVFIVGYSCKK